ncbi:Hypothetical predicted protein, partial [Olea europaea subsp. europaea]
FFLLPSRTTVPKILVEPACAAVLGRCPKSPSTSATMMSKDATSCRGVGATP